jgi:hypothetical protein
MKMKATLVFGLFCAVCAVISAPGQSNVGSARISGHVYSSQDGKPLAGVIVTVELRQGNQDNQHQLTSKDGSFAFDHLEPGGYTVIACRSGLIGESYEMTPPGSDSPLNLRAGQSRDNVDFHLRTSPQITEMPNEAMAAAYPRNLANLSAVYGRFSPDGTLLAIVTKGIVTGDPEQVWLYNLRTQKLFGVTEVPVPKVSPRIHSIAWVGNTLYVDGDRTQSTGHFVVKATAEGAEEILAAPPDAQKILEDARKAYEEDNSIIASYRVRLEKRCHGCALDLTARSLKTTKQLTISNDVNGNFVFDPGAPVVFYPVGSWNDAIFAFNLETRKSARLDLPIHSFRGLLAAKREDGGFLLAYAVTSGSCTPKLSPNGEDVWLLPKHFELWTQKRPMSVCFVRLPDGSEQK